MSRRRASRRAALLAHVGARGSAKFLHEGEEQGLRPQLAQLTRGYRLRIGGIIALSFLSGLAEAMVLLVIGFALFILIMQCLRAVQLEMPIAIVISALPTLGLTVFVKFFVNDKPPSYAFDLLLFKIWRFKTWLFKAGVLSRPPGLWFLPEIIRHPKEF